MTLEEMNFKLLRLFDQGDNAIELIETDYKRELLRVYKHAGDEIKKTIAALFEKYGEKLSYNELKKYNRLNNLLADIDLQIEALKRRDKSILDKALKETYKQSYYHSGYALEASTGLKFGFGLIDPSVIAAAVLNPLDRIKWETYPESIRENSTQLKKRISIEIASGLKRGHGYTKIAQSISKQTGIAFKRSLKISRTESHRAKISARLLSFEKTENKLQGLGLTFVRTWKSTFDERTRPSHRKMDGQVADKKTKLFTFPSGIKTLGPTLSGVAEEDINCRCDVIGEFAEIPQKFRRDNITGLIIPNIKYDEWYKERIAA